MLGFSLLFCLFQFESFDGTAVLTVPHTVFGQVRVIYVSSVAIQADHDGYFDRSPFDGVVGLAFQSISVNSAMPPLINAINQSEFRGFQISSLKLY